MHRPGQCGIGLGEVDKALLTGCPIHNSLFYSTTFTTDANYINHAVNGYDFVIQAQLWAVYGIQFQGCTFQNLRTTENLSTKRGQGIRSLDAQYYVKSKCVTQGPPGSPCQMIPTRFIDLDHGIHAYTASNMRTFTVDQSEFTDNVCGVYVNHTPTFQVQRSTFNIGASHATNLDNIEEVN